jgi:hypothetical protein
MLPLADNKIVIDALIKFNLPYCVIFTDVKEFLSQYINAAKKKNIRLHIASLSAEAS